MNIKIAYLYYDLMNLYGEQGNVTALVQALKEQNIEVSLSKLSIEDEIDFENYDVFIMGSGTDNNQKIVLNHLIKYKEQIKESIEKNKYFLCTGNSIELFGKKINDKEGNEYTGLNIFDYETVQSNERLVSECLFKCSLSSSYILGFQNQSGSIRGYEFDLFDVLEGIGCHKDSKVEGIHYNNFFGTYLIGPILVRNPQFLRKFAIDIILEKNSNYRYKEFDFELNIEAYETFMKQYYPTYYNKMKELEK